MPKFEQILENYKTDYLKYGFIKEEVSFGIIFYEHNSIAEQEIEDIVEMYEQAYVKVVKFFESHANTEPIYIYIYNSFESKENLMGNDWIAQTLYNQREIHHVYTEDVKPIGAHELTHLISLNLGLSVPLFQEGIAEYLQGSDWYGRPHSETLKECAHVFTVDEFLTLDAWLTIPDELALYSYCFLAEFMRVFLSNHPKEVFFEIYRKLSRSNAIEDNLKVLTEY